MKELDLQEDILNRFKSLDGQFPCFIAFSESYARNVYKYLDECQINYFHYYGLDYDGIYKYFIRIISL